MKKWGFLLVLVVFLAGCGSDDPSVARIQQGAFEATLTETGELEAVKSRVIVMPWIGWRYGRPKLAYLIPEGTQVSAGDLVAQADTVGIIKVLREKESDLQIAQADSRNLEVSQANQKSNLEGQITSAKAAFKLAKIQLQKMKFESEKKQAVSQLRFEKERLALRKLQDQLKMMEIKHQNEMKIQQLRIVQLENAIEGAYRALRKTRLFATGNGLVEHRINRRTREKVRAGDQLWPGSPIAGLPDMSQMKVKTAVNETDISKIRLGLPVIVRLDAFPNIQFHGKITEVARLCHEKEKESNIKVFDIIALLEESNPILKPGMTVSCEIVIANLADALFVANQYLKKNGGQYYLNVKIDGKYRRQAVRVGPRNNQFTVIYGNFQKGQRIEHFNREEDD